jgi:hypothetical protein
MGAQIREAVAVCIGCGAAVCLDHSHSAKVWLTRNEMINRIVPVEPPARTLRCIVCAAAHDAVVGDGSGHGRYLATARR